jgi:hypothetical protein
MQWATLAAAALFAQNVAAQGSMLRFACSQLVVERTDPLVNPGMKYTPHLHQIVGGKSRLFSIKTLCLSLTLYLDVTRLGNIILIRL